MLEKKVLKSYIHPRVFSTTTFRWEKDDDDIGYGSYIKRD